MSGSGRISPSRLGPTEYVQAMQARHPQAHASPEVSRRKRRNRMSLFSRQIKDDDAIWKGYERIVGFDTMPDAEDTVSGSASYTLQVKSHGYSRTKHTRTFMCAVDATESRYVFCQLTQRTCPGVDHGESRGRRGRDRRRACAGQRAGWCVYITYAVVTQEKAREGAHSLLSSIVELNGNTRKVRRMPSSRFPSPSSSCQAPSSRPSCAW